ncbi:putative vascular endothelial growth factor A-like [Scophthalmus maximus]|uniref:Putative vascular endothelial growth factor A-like n=1 Tax=Scophthalmus maximus TaxID=52904 RepID=A0A2U9CT57_SCOMX|nr:putative vascular endothelial growth factor A-like [Scophthalmus maximus]
MMPSFTGISHLLLILLVQLVPAQISPPPAKGAPRGMMFQEVLEKSMCHPMEQLVDVEQEFPGEVEYIYLPACVSLWRCSGCCGDENLECHPTLERNITVQMIKIAPKTSSHHVELTFVEHQRCDYASSEHMSSRDATDLEDSPRPVVQQGPQGSGLGPQRSQLAVVGGSYSNLSPMIIMNNVLLKQPSDNPPALKPWGVCPTVEVVQPVVQQPQMGTKENISLGESDTSDSDPDARKKRFCNTYNILSKSGLLDITLRTKELLRQNRHTQNDLDHLKEQTDLFLQAVKSGDTSICVKLQSSLQEEDRERAAQASLKAY